MGADKPKFVLPQATETDSTTGVETDIGTQATEKTSYTLQEGNTVTIPTKHRRKHRDVDGPNSSRASLLIEYFQGGAGSQVDAKPSVRVKVQRPSSKSRSSRNDFVEITETSKTARKPSYTKRIQLDPSKSPVGDGDDHSMNSYRSATEESNVTSRGGGPIEIEVVPRRHGSPLIPSGESHIRFTTLGSDVSSMPADSFLDNTRSPEKEKTEKSVLTRRRSRSLSPDRSVVEKVVEKVRDDKSERRRKHRSRSRSVSTEQIKSPRRRSHHESSLGPESSILSSNVSSNKSSINNPRLLEMVETTIKRLILPELEALKRENSKLQQRRGSVTSGSGLSKDSRDDRSSLRQYSEYESGTGTDLSARPKVMLNDSEVLSGKSRSRKDKNIERVKNTESPRRLDRGSKESLVEEETIRKKKSGDHRGLKTAAAGATVGALTTAALKKHESQESLDEKKERRRRRTKSRSRSASISESYDESRLDVPPPMPLMSEINPSEMTRTSILSAETDRPDSASGEHQITPIREVTRGVASPISRTPTRTPVALQKGLGTQHSNYSRGNLSLQDLGNSPVGRTHEYELDEHGRKVPLAMSPDDEYADSFVEEENSRSQSRSLPLGATGAAIGGAALGAAGVGALLHKRNQSSDSDLMEEEEFRYNQNNQSVPHPLKYVPYAAERRGLSPIQSVSGYTEGDPDPHYRDSRLTQMTHSTGSYSSLNKPYHQGATGRSIRSADSLGNIHNRHDFPDVRQGGLTDSEITQDGEYWDEQHRENDRYRDPDTGSYLSSEQNADFKHRSNYTNDSLDGSELDRAAAGQNVRGIGANPDYVHTPVAVESAVASLVNGSELTTSGFSPTRGYLDRRASGASFQGGEEDGFTSRGNSPQKAAVYRQGSYESSRATPTRRDSDDQYEEYDIDEYGRKVPISQSKGHSKAAKTGLAGIAAGAAAAVLAGRKKKPSADSIEYEQRTEHSGVPANKSFKERAIENQGHLPSPRHSMDSMSQVSHDQVRLGASGIPDLANPMPEIGYGDDQSDITSPSLIRGQGGDQYVDREQWSGRSTPRPLQTPTRERTPLAVHSPGHDIKSDSGLKAAEAALIGAAAAAGGAAALASHSRHTSYDNDDWPRTSKDQKRDTIITNPYEGTSPIAAIGNGLDRDLLAQSGIGNQYSSPFLGERLMSPKDEGYISSAPNGRSPAGITPERRAKGVGFLDQDPGNATGAIEGDPFYTPKHSRHMSGMSHGMDSPVYDSATGTGMDRIQSKDIVALMDHLTVRDAQRSARDTEILVTLVRAAAEMRNSFEDMKRLLADTEDVIITEVQGNTEKSVQKVINGPRPPPPSAPRSIRPSSQDDMYDDIPNKRRNVFRRALKGLSMRSSNDLGKIEEMLVQLLGEVEGLKVAQGLKADGQLEGSYDDLRQEGSYENDRGYEADGHASTASHASQSGHLSIPPARGYDTRKFSDHRISTVPEGDEDALSQHEQEILNNQFERNEELFTPTREITRSDSVPLGTPPQHHTAAAASHSVENTPKTDKSKRHKSSSSSGWIPKVSRWSETTASTVLRGFRGSGGKKRDDQFDPPSRSGSDLAQYADQDREHEHHPYGEDKLHSGFSQNQVDQYDDQDPSLLPPEDPKYKAHRNSLNLQHPQPRPGPTHRYQTALEYQAQDFNSPMSPRSVEWGASQTSLNRLPPQQTNRYSNTTNNTNPGHLSPISDGSYAHEGPMRPPKEPLGPERPPKVLTGTGKLAQPSPLSNEHLPVEDTGRLSTGYEPQNSPQSIRSAPRVTSGNLSAVPARKPTGPRSMSSASRSGELKHELQNKDSGTVRRNKNRGMPQ